MKGGINRFWIVYGAVRSSEAERYGSLAGAKAEAVRLAKQWPGETFAIMAAVDAYRADYEFSRVTIEDPASQAEAA